MTVVTFHLSCRASRMGGVVPPHLSQLLAKFHHSQFRSQEQRGAIETLIGGGKDVYVSMPTGG